MTTLKGRLSGFGISMPKILKSWLNLLISIPLIAVITTGCLPAEAPPFFSPGGGSYADSANVYLNLPEGTTQVFYTLDGTTPQENCLQYTGGTIEISESATLKVKYWIGLVEQPVQEAIYNITGGGSSGGGGVYTNADMVEAWVEMETGAEVNIATAYNGGCTFVVEVPDGSGGCAAAGGFGDLDKLDKWYYLCDNGSVPSPIGGSPAFVPATPAECGADGFVVMGLFTEGLGGRTDFIFSDHDYLLDSGEILHADAHTVGHFNLDQNGTIGTQEGATGILTGAFNGTVESSVIVTAKVPSGGFYVTSCSDPGCEQNKTYLVSAGPVYTVFEPSGEASCQQPSYLLHNSSNGNCLTAGANTGAFSLINTFCANTPSQQWDIKPVTITSEANDFTIELADGSGCLQPYTNPDFTLFLWRNTEFAPCGLGDADQIWTMTYMGNGQTRIEARPGFFGPGTWHCLGTFNTLNNELPEILVNACTDTGEWNRWEILPDGQFPPINPLTYF